MTFSVDTSSDYLKFLNELGLTESDMQRGLAVSAVTEDSLPSRCEVKKSDIHGLGVFVSEEVHGTLGVFLSGKGWSLLGRYTNHSSSPNSIVVEDKRSGDIYLLSSAKSGEEVTVNYRQVKEVIDERL